MKKYNLSNIMKRAWELVKKFSITISEGLKKSWKEAREMKENLVDSLKENLEKIAYDCAYIHMGIDRRVQSKVWEKNGQKREYLTIACFTGNGRYKGSYKCGYVDLVTNTYVCGAYDDVNAETLEYIG